MTPIPLSSENNERLQAYYTHFDTSRVEVLEMLPEIVSLVEELKELLQNKPVEEFNSMGFLMYGPDTTRDIITKLKALRKL